MYVPMIPCTACARHVRARDARCPFCDAEISAEARARVAPDTNRRLTRAAAFMFGITVAGCSSTVTSTDAAPGDTATATDAPRTDRPAGDTAVANDTAGGTDVITSRDAPEDHGNIAPPYGIPADAGPPDDDGGGGAEYGAPPMDAGAPDDRGANVALYGLPPPTDV